MTVFDLLQILCGLALFLYGMSVMSDGLKKSAGSRLKTILGRMTANPIKGFLFGAAVTAVVQSSSATTVMIVGFVNSGTMTLAQSVAVTMGANVGAAATYWLTALSSLGGGVGNLSSAVEWLKPSSWMPILAIVGAGIRMFSKRGRSRDIAGILLGFSVLMVGMDLMSSGAGVLEQSESFTGLLTLFRNPLFGFFAGILITAAVQSSAASVGILQSLAVTGAISWGAAIPIILGQNIGTCITALLSSIGAGKNAKRSALIHLYFNLFGGLFFLALYWIFSAALSIPALSGAIDAFGIAGAHTILKLFYVALLAPFSKLLVRLSQVTVPEGEQAAERANLLDERLMNTPAVAVNRATEVTAVMADLAVNGFLRSMTLLGNYDAKVAAEVRRMEEEVDIYEDTIGTYLVKLSGCNVGLSDSHQITKLLHMIGDFERISDHSVNLVESAEEMAEKKIVFSEEARREVSVLRAAVTEILDLALHAFVYNDLRLAIEVEPLEQVVDDLREQIKRNHILRLQKSECTIEHGFVLADILTNYERVSDHCSNIAGCVLEIQRDELDMHRYLESVKEGSPEFEKMYKAFSEKYAI